MKSFKIIMVQCEHRLVANQLASTIFTVCCYAYDEWDPINYVDPTGMDRVHTDYTILEV